MSIRCPYSGAEIRRFTAAVARSGTLAVSSDGTQLFVNDVVNRRVVALDTQTGGELQRYPWGSLESSGLGYARPNAYPVIMLGNGKVFDVDSARQHTSFIRDSSGTEDLSFAVDPLGRHVVILNHGVQPSTFREYRIAYEALTGDPLTLFSRGDVWGGVFGQGLCASADGARVYVANGSQNVLVHAIGGLAKLGELPGGTPNNVACGWNGLVFAGNGGVVRSYRADGTPAGMLNLLAANGTLVLSGDNSRIAGSFDARSPSPTQSLSIISVSGP